MLQRPQSLVFLGAAILAIVAAFAPIASYSPNLEEVLPKHEELDLRVVVAPSDMSIEANYVQSIHNSQESYEKGLTKANEALDQGIAESGYSLLFTLGMVGCLLLGVCILILIFLYNNRKVQIRIGIALFLISVLVTAGVFLASNFAVEIVSHLEAAPYGTAQTEWITRYNFGIFLYPLMTMLVLVGVLMVRKDDNLVKSLDRLR